MIYNNTSISRFSIATSGVFEEEIADICFSILSKDSSLISSLSSNVFVSSKVKNDLYNSKLAVNDAISLVSTVLPDSLVSFIVKSERRSKVLCSLIEHNVLSLDDQRLVAVHVQDTPRKALLKSSYCDLSLRKFLACSLKNVSLLEELTIDSSESFTHAERVNFVENFDSWFDYAFSFKEVSFILSLMFYKYPELIPHGLNSSNSMVVTAACGSMFVKDSDCVKLVNGKSESFLENNRFALMALAANPAVSLKTVSLLHSMTCSINSLSQVVMVCNSRLKRGNDSFSDWDLVSDETILNFLVNRAVPSEYKPLGRPLELAVLMANPYLGDYNKELVTSYLRAVDSRVFKVLPERILSAIPASFLTSNTQFLPSIVVEPFVDKDIKILCDEASEVLGSSVSSWECFLSLVDDYEGELSDLLVLAKTL